MCTNGMAIQFYPQLYGPTRSRDTFLFCKQQAKLADMVFSAAMVCVVVVSVFLVGMVVVVVMVVMMVPFLIKRLA